MPVGVPYPIELPDQRATVVPLGDGTWRVTLSMNQPPEQVTVDPDRVLLDANPGDNVWRSDPCGHFTPLYTMLDETDMTSDYDRWNFTAGPWMWGPSYQDPWYTRSTMIGLRAGANRPQQFRGGAYAAFRTDYRDLVAGADAVFLGDHKEVGFNWERRIGGPWGGQEGASGPNRAVAYFRQVLKPGSSLYLPPVMYQDGFATYQDNFLPFARTPGGNALGSPLDGRLPLSAESLHAVLGPGVRRVGRPDGGGRCRRLYRLARHGAGAGGTGRSASTAGLDWAAQERPLRGPRGGDGCVARLRAVLRPGRRHALPRFRPRRAAGEHDVGG